MERKHTKRAAVTDEEVEAEIAELKQDEYVKLAQRYDQYRARRRRICTSCGSSSARASSWPPEA